MKGWIVASGAACLLRAVARCNGERDAELLRDRFELPPGVGSDNDRIPIATMIELWEAGLAITRRRDLAVVAQSRSTHDEGSVIAFLATNQPTVGGALDAVDRYAKLTSDCFCWRVADDGERVALHVDPIGPIDRLGWQAFLEFETIDLIAIGRRLSAAVSPLYVGFAHPRPRTLGDLARIGDLAPAFAAPAQQILYPSSIRDLPVAGARPQLAAMLRERLDAMLEELDDATSVTVRARRVVPVLLRAHRAHVADLAKRLAMSRRALERALASEGTSAARLFDDERRRLALLWLPRLTIGEISSRLGYSSGPAFSRAFRRWTGRAPTRAIDERDEHDER